jgi:hypothetical protein
MDEPARQRRPAEHDLPPLARRLKNGAARRAGRWRRGRRSATPVPLVARLARLTRLGDQADVRADLLDQLRRDLQAVNLRGVTPRFGEQLGFGVFGDDLRAAGGG